MSSEPLTTTPAETAPESAEKGLLVAVLLMVLLGTAALVLMT